jgi:hypothetical protein
MLVNLLSDTAPASSAAASPDRCTSVRIAAPRPLPRPAWRGGAPQQLRGRVVRLRSGVIGVGISAKRISGVPIRAKISDPQP